MSNLSCGTHVAEPSANKDCRKLLNQFCRFLPKLKLPISADAKLPLTSQHTKGQAADIASDAPIRLARIVIDEGLDFDQMILYPNFIHLSYTLERENRKQILYNKDYYGPKLQML